MVGGPDEALVLHTLDERGGAVIAYAEPPLDIAGRGLSVPEHDGHGLVVELVAGLAVFLSALAVLVLVVVLFGDGFEIGGHALLLEVTHYLLHLVVGHQRAVHAHDPATARHIEHVALAEQLLGALLAENGAAVDLGGDLEADAGREVRLDRAGDVVDARTL